MTFLSLCREFWQEEDAVGVVQLIFGMDKAGAYCSVVHGIAGIVVACEVALKRECFHLFHLSFDFLQDAKFFLAKDNVNS